MKKQTEWLMLSLFTILLAGTALVMEQSAWSAESQYPNGWAAKGDKTMLSANDKLAILDTIARYNLAADKRDVEATVNLYTDDGYIDGDFQARAGEAFGEDLRKIFEMEGTLKRHVSTNHIIEGEGDQAVVDSLLTVFEGETAPAVLATVVIHDELRKVDGHWLVARHHVAIDPSARGN
jgi:ketosteroid isomerase-like protein